MADRKPVVLLPNNNLAELPVGDSLAWSLLSGVPVYATRWPTWDEVSGKPTTFPPAAHTHTISQVTGLQAALDGKLDRVVEYSPPDANSLPTGNFLGNLYGEATSNTPTGSWTQIIQSTNGNKTWGFQLAKAWFQNELYLRSLSSGSWTNWFRIWHSGNQPRIFVQAGDPGAAAADGDLWIW